MRFSKGGNYHKYFTVYSNITKLSEILKINFVTITTICLIDVYLIYDMTWIHVGFVSSLDS